MRRVLMCGVALIAMTAGAVAADMPDMLRGSQQIVTMPGGGARWDGFYVGGHVGWSAASVDFTNNTTDVANLLASTPIRTRTVTPLENGSANGMHYGGFIGYNTQWDGAIVGIEGTYNWIKRPVTGTNQMFGAYGAPADQLSYNAAGSVTANVVDYGTIRIRGGWAASGTFMPYAFLGFAAGRVDINRSVAVVPAATAGTPPGTFVPGPFTVGENLNNVLSYGYSVGAGLDICVIANLFVRAEYEYVQFGDTQGLKPYMHNARIGAALKF